VRLRCHCSQHRQALRCDLKAVLAEQRGRIDPHQLHLVQISGCCKDLGRIRSTFDRSPQQIAISLLGVASEFADANRRSSPAGSLVCQPAPVHTGVVDTKQGWVRLRTRQRRSRFRGFVVRHLPIDTKVPGRRSEAVRYRRNQDARTRRQGVARVVGRVSRRARRDRRSGSTFMLIGDCDADLAVRTVTGEPHQGRRIRVESDAERRGSSRFDEGVGVDW